MIADANDKVETDAGIASDDISVLDSQWQTQKTPLSLIDEPLDFLIAEHHRQRQAALALHLIADGETNCALMADLIAFFEVDFGFHNDDEDLCFFPLVEACCTLEDDIGPLIRRLTGEHSGGNVVVRAIEILNRRLGGADIQNQERAQLRQLAEHIRQHLALENAVLLPIARARMDHEELAELSRQLKRRRQKAANANNAAGDHS